MARKPKKVKAGTSVWVDLRDYPPIYLCTIVDPLTGDISGGCFYYNREGDRVWCCGPNKGKIEKKKDLDDQTNMAS